MTETDVDASIARHEAELMAACDILDRNRGQDTPAVRQAAQRREFLHGYLAALRHVRYAMTHDDWTLR